MVDVNALGNIGRHIATEGKARYREFGRFWMRRLCVGNHRQHIFNLAHAIVVYAIAVAHATQIGQITVIALFTQGFGHGLDDFVGVGAALGGIGVVNHRHTDGGVGLRRDGNGFQAACRAVYPHDFRLFQHIICPITGVLRGGLRPNLRRQCALNPHRCGSYTSVLRDKSPTKGRLHSAPSSHFG